MRDANACAYKTELLSFGICRKLQTGPNFGFSGWLFGLGPSLALPHRPQSLNVKRYPKAEAVRLIGFMLKDEA